MPKSKSRAKQKPRAAARRYRLDPDRKHKSRESPKWYAPVVLGVMAVGVITIVLNYMQVLPGTDAGPRNLFLWSGLALIAVGFIGTTGWR